MAKSLSREQSMDSAINNIVIKVRTGATFTFCQGEGHLVFILIINVLDSFIDDVLRNAFEL